MSLSKLNLKNGRKCLFPPTVMRRIADFKNEDLHTLRRQVRREYETFRARCLTLDMTRGKPAPEQLDLANDLLALPGKRDHFTEAGDDARNYGGLQGLAEVRALFAAVLGARVDRVIASDNSSLAVMHDCIVWALLKGVPGSAAPWSHTPAPAFICPVPGYDRHFAICEEYGIRMLPVPMTGQGPDMETVEELIADPAVKGMWCVPKYSNPTTFPPLEDVRDASEGIAICILLAAIEKQCADREERTDV